ncbi:MAG TPA: glycosyl hydrolase family 65 protein [Pilimelia sp.]|nr:glycosyl hydrolase family 65 protein [Pilimelia sp.]
MSRVAEACALDRTFESVVFDWDGTAVVDRHASAAAVRQRVEALCGAGVDVVVVSGTHVGNVDGQLRARPDGPGRLMLCLNRGSELFDVDGDGPRLRERRVATPAEEAALDRAASLVVARLRQRGLIARIVSSRLNRRKIDLLPDPRWVDPPKARIGELLAAVTGRLRAHRLEDLAAVVRLASDGARDAGLAGARITSDAKHVEIGLTDNSDSMRAILAWLAQRGVGPGLVLVLGDEFGPLGGVPGSDSLLLVPEAARAYAVSVGVEPAGVPAGVSHVGGGPAMFLRLLDEQLRRRRHRRVPAVDDDPAWTVCETGRDPLRHRVTETLFTLGAGGFATRGSAEDAPAGSVPLTLASGVYTSAGAGQHLLPGPDWTGLSVVPSPAEDRRVLDLRCGLLWREETGVEPPLRTLRFVSAARPGVVALRAEAAADRLRPGPPLRPPAEGRTDRGRLDGRRWARVRADRPAAATGDPAAILAVAAEHRGQSAEMRTVERMAAYAADPRGLPALDNAVAALDAAGVDGFDRLLAEHRAAWAARWDAVDVSIPDDPAAQLAVRFALFHLWGNVDRRDEAAVGARGLSGTGYAGHVFWDADVYVLPAMASIAPAAARAMLQYRLRRLGAARAAARATGYAGARFPWESAADGRDVTPASGYLGGELVPILTGRREEHVTADVAWAAHHYAAWTGDRDFLTGPGRPLVVDTARYWASRCRLDGAGRAHIDAVIGPDEYHESVTDNAYTNVMARWNLKRAADLVNGAGPAEAEARRWRDLADRLVDGYHPPTGRYEQFAGYFDLEPLLAADVSPRSVAADVLLGHDRIAATQLIKQPDVLMLHHLVPEEVAPGSLHPNLDFYGPRTAHGSSLSPAITAALLARAGRPDDALRLLRVALALDLDDLTGTTATGLHIATLGGLWQAILTGFAGARTRGRVLRVDPVLPAAWPRLGLRFHCLSRAVRLNLTHDTVEIWTDAPLRVEVAGHRPQVVDSASPLARRLA